MTSRRGYAAGAVRLLRGCLLLGFPLRVLDETGDAIAIFARRGQRHEALPGLDGAGIVALDLVEDLASVEEGRGIVRIYLQRLVEGLERGIGMSAHGHDEGQVGHGVDVALVAPHSLRDRYEGRAAEVIARLDAMGPVITPPPPAPEPESVGPAPWTRRPATLTVGGFAMLALGIGLGVGVSRYTTPAETMIPPESRLPVLTSPDPGPLLQGKSGAPMKTIPPEMLAGMLSAARPSYLSWSEW